MKSKSFNVGDKVFAKIKGYPTWPAKIESLNGKRYNVYFYGTGEAGIVKAEDLYLYAENKQKFIKAIKRKDYNEAVEQIEAEILAEGGVILEQNESLNTDTISVSTPTKISKKTSEATVTKSEQCSSSIKLEQSSNSIKSEQSSSLIKSEQPLKTELESEKEEKVEQKQESNQEIQLDSKSEDKEKIIETNEQMEIEKVTEDEKIDEDLLKLQCDEPSIEMVDVDKTESSFIDSEVPAKTIDLSETPLSNIPITEPLIAPKLIPTSSTSISKNVPSISLTNDSSTLEVDSDQNTPQKQIECLEITDSSVKSIEPIDTNAESIMSNNLPLKRKTLDINSDEGNDDCKRIKLVSDEKVPITTTVLTTTVNSTNQKQGLEVNYNQEPVHQKATVSNRIVKAEHPMEEERRDLISRSGRKIKPKKYLDDEEVTENITAALQSAQARRIQRKEPEAVPIVHKEITPSVNNNNNVSSKSSTAPSFGNHLYISKKRIQYLLSKDESIEEHARKRNITNIDVSDYEFEMSLKEILLVKLQNEPNYIGIKFKLNRPRQFKNELERWQWDKEAMKNALEMKNKLENNESSIHDVNKDMLVLNLELMANDIIRNERLQMAKSKDNRIVLLKSELAFWSTIESIKLNLGLQLDNVDTKKAIELMDKLISMKSCLNPVILKKNPGSIEAISKLRFYVGNVNQWNLNIGSLFPFNQNATIIREKANLLWKYFQQICKIPEPLPFWDEYNKQKDVFNAALEHYPKRAKVALTCEPHSMEYYNDKFDDAVGKFFENLI